MAIDGDQIHVHMYVNTWETQTNWVPRPQKYAANVYVCVYIMI